VSETPRETCGFAVTTSAAAAGNEFRGIMAFDSMLLTEREKQLLQEAGGSKGPLSFLDGDYTDVVMELLTTICGLRAAAKGPVDDQGI